MVSPADARLVNDLKKELAKVDRHLASLLTEPGFDQQRMAYQLESKRNMIAKQIKRLGGK